MAKFEDFSIDPSKTYVLMNSQGKFSTGARITNTGDGQYLAIAFDAAARKFVAIPFTHFEESAAPATGSATARPQGTFQGSNIFIVRHINPELGLRPNLSAELDAWKDSVKFNLAKPLVRDTSFGQLLIDIQKLFKEQLTEQKRLLDEQAAAAAAAPTPTATPVAQEPAPAAPPVQPPAPPVQPPAAVAQPPERQASIIPAAREVLQRPQSQRPAVQDFDFEDIRNVVSGGDDADGDFSSITRRITGTIQMPFRDGYTFIDHDTSANDGRSVFVHQTRLGGLTFEDNEPIEFELIDGNRPGTVQAGNISKPGEAPVSAQRAERQSEPRQRDPRSLPPIVDNSMTLDEGEPYDPNSTQPWLDGGSPFQGAPRTDRSGKVFIPDAWFNEPFNKEEVAGGAPRPVRSDSGLSRRRGPGNDEPGQS